MPLEPGVKIGPYDLMAVAIDTAATFDFEPRTASSRVTFDSLDSLRHTMSRRVADSSRSRPQPTRRFR